MQIRSVTTDKSIN